MRLRFSAAALDHLEAIWAFIAEHNQGAATRIVGRVRSAANTLVQFPQMGRRGFVPGTFEWVVRGTPYILVYALRDGPEVLVLGVFHGARDR